MASAAECPPLYPYHPNLVLACVGIGLFTVLAGIHMTRMFMTRTWDNIFFVLGGLCQATGCIARAYSSKNACSRAASAAQAVLLLMGPTLLMFTITLVHTTYIRALGAESRAWVPVRFQRPIYLAVNVICFIIQICGGIDLGVAQTRSLAELGSKLKIAAYVTQMVFWGYILAENTWITVRLGIAIKKAEKATLEPVSTQGTISSSILSVKERFPHYKRWSQLFGLSISIIGFGRNLMRLTELGVAFLQDNEWTSYAFDIYQMVVVMGALAVWYLPGKVDDVAESRARYQHLEMEVPKSTLEGRSVERDNGVFNTYEVKPSTPRAWV